MRCLAHLHPERRRQLAERGLGGGGVERHLAAEEAVGVDVAEHQRGVGDGRARATEPVAGGAGVGAGALGADAQQAARVDPRDRAAAGADRAHVDGGEAGEVPGERLAEPGLAGEHEVAGAHERDVEAGAAGVADDHVARARLGCGDGARGDGRERGTGAHRPQRAVDQLAHRHDAAGGAGGEQLAGEALLLQAACDLGQVTLHQRLQRCIDRGAGGAAVLAHDRVDLVRERVGHAWQLALDQLAERQLVRGVGGRPQQANRDGLRVQFTRAGELRAGGALVERHEHVAVGVDPLWDLERQAARYVWLGEGAAVVVGAQRATLAAHEDVREALGAEEGGPCCRALEDRVGRLRGGEDEQRGAREQLAQWFGELLRGALQCGTQPVEQARRLCQRLGDRHLAALVADDDVGEGPADVAGDPCCGLAQRAGPMKVSPVSIARRIPTSVGVIAGRTKPGL